MILPSKVVKTTPEIKTIEPEIPLPGDRSEPVIKGKQYRHLCYTFNNYTPEDLAIVKGWNAKYNVFGQEIGEVCKTPHLQGYVEWSSPKRWDTIKSMDKRIHWGVRKGKSHEARDYCKKGEQSKAEWRSQGVNGPNWGKNASIFEKGDCSNQGKRTDLDDVCDKMVAGASIRDIAKDHTVTFVKFHKGFKALGEELQEDRTEPPKVYWRYGLAGVGKTRYIYDNYSLQDIYSKNSSRWWDKYNQQKVILMDDFDGFAHQNSDKFRELLKVIDRYPHSVETKGGTAKINSPLIYITCEFPPSKFWSGNDLDQITRRLTSIDEITAPNEAKTA